MSRAHLTRFDLTMIVISLVIGMGIFRTPALVAADAGSTVVFFAAWLFAGLVSLCGALMFAEIGSRYPCHGGFYPIMAKAFHPAAAFSVNWATLLSNAGSTAAVAMAGCDYLFALITPDSGEWPPIHRQVFCIAIIAVLFMVNWIGLRMSATMQNALMVMKIGMILLLIVSPLFVTATHPLNDTLAGKPAFSLLSFALCFKSVFFTYGGYQQTVNFGADMKNAHRMMPKAILVGFAVILLLYLAVNMAYVRTLGLYALGQTKTPAALVVQHMLGERAGIAFSLFMFFCVMGYVNVCMLSNPRVFYAMARDGVMPARFGQMHEGTGVPRAALTLFSALIIFTLFLTAEFEKVVNVIMFFDSISFMALAGSIFYLRKNKISLLSNQPYRIRFYPWLPIFFMASYFTLSVSILINNWRAPLIGLLVFGAGWLLYYRMRKPNDDSPSTHP